MIYLLTYTFVILGILGCILYLQKRTRNMSYLVLAVAFLALGTVGLLDNEKSSVAAYFLAVLALHSFKTKFDRK